jgi:hypothetical protein
MAFKIPSASYIHSYFYYEILKLMIENVRCRRGEMKELESAEDNI